MAVPYKCLISLDKGLADPDIGIVFAEHELFSIDNPDREQLILCVMLMWETQKGADSFWYHHINMMPEG